MNNRLRHFLAGLLFAFSSVCASAQTPAPERVPFSKHLTRSQSRCLDDLFNTPRWRDYPTENAKLKKIAQAAAVHLDGVGRRDYVYVFETRGWCGTAGCLLLIGEVGRDGACRLLYDGYGDTGFSILRRRDHGYHRIYAPCEARYDGQQYRQVNEECPTALLRH